MKDSKLTIRQHNRLKSVIKQAAYSKKISPEKRWNSFANLQNAVAKAYWQGLKDRYPNADGDELRSIAFLEAKARNERRKRFRRAI